LDAQEAIDVTSGHCAVKENGFLDDGTFTAVKIQGLLAQERQMSQQSMKNRSLLNLIASLKELQEVVEFRLQSFDGSLDNIFDLFGFVALEIEAICDEHDSWTVDADNLEGIRVSTGSDGGYFFVAEVSS
jgi:hypothetical protein